MKQAIGWMAFTAAILIVAPAARPEPAGQTLALSHAIHAVEDLDTTLAFYRDVFGIDGTAVEFDNPAVPLLTNAPGVTLRLSMVGLPGGTRFEFTHFMGLERKPGTAAYTDPGAAGLVLHVRDIDALVAAARSAGATIVTTGGKPVEITTADGRARSIIMRDPDGFFVQLIEDTPATSAAGDNIQGVSLAYTMQDARTTREFYTEMMGIELSGTPAFVRDAELARLVGAPEDVEFRKLSGLLPPGTAVEFTEFRGVPRQRFHLRVRDPGAPALAVQVSNIEGMVAQMKSAGVNVISANGELVDFGNGIFNIFVEDPNGMNLELFERFDER
ncbi:MAG: VOC family protein [Gammaproteobacteria bacterium]|jgi:catechol 2,3-dioxygenase-like lactoylglutathione lyase family enzyme